MKSAWIFAAIVAATVVALATRHSPDTATTVATASAPAQQSQSAPTISSAPVHASMQDQEECNTRARKAADKWITTYNESPINRVYGSTIESHMNARLGECLVLIMGSITYNFDYELHYHPAYRIDPKIGILFDAIGGHGFGYYYWDNPNRVVAPPPQSCTVEGVDFTNVPCGTQDDWYAATREYMTQ